MIIWGEGSCFSLGKVFFPPHDLDETSINIIDSAAFNKLMQGRQNGQISYMGSALLARHKQRR